jgi:CRP/FNR family transcriptional regulator, anaerobic regulatory protein
LPYPRNANLRKQGTLVPVKPPSATPVDAPARLLAAYPSLANLPPALRQQVVGQLTLMRLPAGSMLFREQDACGGFPMVLSGHVRISRLLADGRELVLYDVGPGESCVLSTSCLLGNARYNAHGACETDVELALLPRALFDQLVAEHRPFRAAVFNLFGERLVRLVELAEAVGFQRVEQRLAAALLGAGRELSTSHEKLAQRLGASRETVSRALKVLEGNGWVRLRRGVIEILQPQQLRAAAEGGPVSVTHITEENQVRS